jgi:hypothetical protein
MIVLLALCLRALTQSDPGTYDDSSRLYRNRTYAFSCRVPAGWVLRTEQIKPDGAADNQVLLAAFERPPEAISATPASTILIASESQSAYPGMKTAEDYFAPLTEVVTAKGFKAVNDPYPFAVGAVQVMREDFSHEQKDRPEKDHPEKDHPEKDHPERERPGKEQSGKEQSDKDRATTYQSTLVVLSHGSIVSFSFLAASEDDVDNLIENLSFTSGNAPKTAPKSRPKTAPAKKANTPQNRPS